MHAHRHPMAEAAATAKRSILSKTDLTPLADAPRRKHAPVMRRQPIEPGPWLGTSAAVVAILAPSFAGLECEAVRVLHLDGAHRLIRQSGIVGAARSSIDLPLRLIIREALANDARALILAHNHPDGDPTPSAADKIATRRLAEIAGPLNLQLLDHLIFAGDAVTSFRALGLL